MKLSMGRAEGKDQGGTGMTRREVGGVGGM